MGKKKIKYQNKGRKKQLVPLARLLSCHVSLGPDSMLGCSPKSPGFGRVGGWVFCLFLKRAAFGLTVKKCEVDAPTARSVADCVYKSFLSWVS